MALSFEPLNFQLLASFLGITFLTLLTDICIRPIDHSAHIGS